MLVDLHESHNVMKLHVYESHLLPYSASPKSHNDFKTEPQDRKKHHTRNQINKLTKTKEWLAGIPQQQLWSSDNKSNGAKILTQKGQKINGKCEEKSGLSTPQIKDCTFVPEKFKQKAMMVVKQRIYAELLAA